MRVARKLCSTTGHEECRGGSTASAHGLEPTILQLHDLPVGVLLDDLLVFEPVDVAALVVEILAVSALSPPKYLKIGDVMEIEIEGIGRLKTPFMQSELQVL